MIYGQFDIKYVGCENLWLVCESVRLQAKRETPTNIWEVYITPFEWPISSFLIWHKVRNKSVWVNEIENWISHHSSGIKTESHSFCNTHSHITHSKLTHMLPQGNSEANNWWANYKSAKDFWSCLLFLIYNIIG